MQHSYKKIIDLRKRASQPLVVQRAEKMRRNVLRLKKVSARSFVDGDQRPFDFRRKSKSNATDSVYLPAKKNSGSEMGKLKIISAALVCVFALNLAGIFGSGKQVLEKTVASAFSGIGDLIVAAESFAAGDFVKSESRFAEAITVLQAAEENLLILGGAGAILETQPEKVQAGSRLVSAAKLLASGGEKFAEAANKFSLTLKTWNVRQQAITAGYAVESFSSQLKQPSTGILSGLSDLESAAALLNLVQTDALPIELQTKVSRAIDEVNYFLEISRPLAEILPEIPNLLGDKIPRRYLILFQNTDELRPTGGFIGSVGILDLNDGFAQKFEIKDVYEIDGQLRKHLSPPEGFGFITGSWGLRDANYHPDFATSATAASFLFEEAGFGSVDGVIAVNSTLLEKITATVGGVQLARFGEKVEAADLNLLLELIIEAKVDGTANPKLILAEIWAALRDDLGKLSQRTLAEIAWQAIVDKEVQFASSNPDLQKIAQATGTANELRETDGDYLFVVNTSLSGNKSDQFCVNEITHTSEIADDGKVVDELRILRKHDWSATAERRIENLAEKFGIPLSDNLKEILGRGRNIDLLKVFVPTGSELISVEGIPRESVEVKESNGKTYFMFSLTIQPKFSREVILKYKLPQKFEENYSFLGEFQSGDSVREIEKVVKKDGAKIFEGEINLGTERIWGL